MLIWSFEFAAAKPQGKTFEISHYEWSTPIK